MNVTPHIWYRLGTGLIILSWILFFVMQAVSGDWLPPDISFSQYGIGPHGWILSVYLISMAAGALCLDRGLPTRRITTIVLLIGAAGALVMALVRTDPGGLQESVQAKVHMVGSVIGNSLIPIGCCLLLVYSRRLPRWVPIGLVSIAGVCLVLLLISATGVDTLGVGAATSWVYWQTAACVMEMILFAVTAFYARPDSENRHIRAVAAQQRDAPV